jgi:hypothetical protein
MLSMLFKSGSCNPVVTRGGAVLAGWMMTAQGDNQSRRQRCPLATDTDILCGFRRSGVLWRLHEWVARPSAQNSAPRTAFKEHGNGGRMKFIENCAQFIIDVWAMILITAAFAMLAVIVWG